MVRLSRPKLQILLPALVLGALAGGPTPAWAAPPANDAFSAAAVIVGASASNSGTTLGASTEAGEPALTTESDADHPLADTVWYSWTAPASGYAEFNTCVGNQVDVFSGDSVGAATRLSVPFTSGACSPFISNDAAEIAVTAGTTYHVRVGAPSTTFAPTAAAYSPGPFMLNVNPAPHNDLLSAPFAISDSIVNDTLSGNVGSTGAWPSENIRGATEPNERQVAGITGGHTVWFSWTAPSNTTYTFTTCGSAIDTLLGVYTGTTHPLTLVADDDDAPGVCPGEPGASAAQFLATQGVTYKIAVDGKNGAQGPFILNAPPSNDALADLMGTIFDFSTGATFVGSSSLATDAPGEPAHAGITGTHSLWFQKQLTAGSSWIFSTCGSAIDTTLDAYAGGGAAPTFATIGAAVASNDDFPGCSGTNRHASAVVVTAASTAIYRLAVDTPSSGGQVTLQARRAATNDAFASAGTVPAVAAVPVSAFSGNLTNLGMSAEAGEPAHAGSPAAHSLWFKVTPGVTGPLTLNTCGSFFDTVLAVYTGTAVNALTPVPGASNDDTASCGTGTESAVTFAATAGTTYSIAIDGRAGAVGFGRLNVQPPPNDAFDAAAALPAATPQDIVFSTTGSSLQAAEPTILGNIIGASVWYSWTAPVGGTASLNGCPADANGPFITFAAAYTGSSVGSLQPASTDNAVDGCPGLPQFGSHASFHAVAGTTYHLQVQSSGGVPGRVRLELAPDPAVGTPPPAATPPTGTPPLIVAPRLPSIFGTLKLPAHLRIADLLGHGVTVSIRCTRACNARMTFAIPAKTASKLHLAARRLVAVATVRGSRSTAGTLVLKLKATRRAAKALRGLRSLSGTLTVTGRDPLGGTPATVVRSLSLKH